VATRLDQPSQRVRAIIQMTTSLQLVTIAEGVESESTESL
jgi:EAL domain-containing protein (putative c-di-GMP-specific phosphodiesterase class I)